MKKLLLLVLLAALVLPFIPAMGQEEVPVVCGVLFWSPRCPHCHHFIDNQWPGLHARYGEQFNLIFLNVDEPAANAIFRAMYADPSIPLTGGVPAMVIGTTVLTGGIEIPQRAPGLIEQGLAAGGVALPAIAGLEGLCATTVAPGAAGADAFATPATPSLFERLAADPVANGLAVIILGLLVVSLIVVVLAVVKLRRGDKALAERLSKRAGPLAALVFAVLGALTVSTLILEQSGETLVQALAWAALAGMVALVFGTIVMRTSAKQPAPPTWLVPVAAVIGLAVAGYLAFVEVSEAEAYCGVIGNCNLVQQSDYAFLFGVLPVGVAGIIGYSLILLLWFARRAGVSRAREGLLLLVLFGVAFSIYLTFLEPFVIGATCMWCLTSAILMALLLWLVVIEDWKPQPDLKRRHA
ncbi:MAG: vitamin K epoxide reductase family protein [Aggregatilineales bacterium]